MNTINISSLFVSEIKVIKIKINKDHRGYFTEIFKSSEFKKQSKEIPNLFVQINESYSKKYTLRGMHFQWNPYMGKLVRTISGWMIDLILDIRKNSPTFGKIIAYSMKCDVQSDLKEWIWIPPGFAHGNFFLENTLIEYLCTGEYNPDCEVCISPFAKDIDWTLINKKLINILSFKKYTDILITQKDKQGLNMAQWSNDKRSSFFLYPMR